MQKASLTRKIRFIITVKSNIILRLLCKKKESKTHRMRLTFQITHIWTRIFYDDSRQASALGVCNLNDVLTNKKLQKMRTIFAKLCHASNYWWRTKKGKFLNFRPKKETLYISNLDYFFLSMKCMCLFTVYIRQWLIEALQKIYLCLCLYSCTGSRKKLARTAVVKKLWAEDCVKNIVKLIPASSLANPL